MRFAPPLLWPATVPSVTDYAGWTAIDRMTHGRGIDGVELVDVELRARRLLYRFGLPPGELQGSQFKGTWRYPYYVELFAHEMGHLLHLGMSFEKIGRNGSYRLTSAMKQLSKDEADENEVEAAATATLVIEDLGLPYTLQYLLSSTVTNSNAKFLMTRQQLYLLVKGQREQPKTKKIARQLTHLLLKMKHAEEAITPEVLQAAS